MQLVLAGVNHKSAPLPVREQLAFSSSEMPDFYEKLRARGLEGFLLSTCNRTELYALAGHEESGSAALIALLAESRGLLVDDIRQYFYVKSFDEAVAHLFSVSSGLDSMVPGEDQILGQLRAALDTARVAKALGPVMHRLGASALSVGKSAHAETGIGRHSLSLVSVALQAATRELKGLAGRPVLVIGAGQTARLAVRHLEKARAAITICNRTRANAEALNAEGIHMLADWERLEDAFHAADVIVSCTNAPDPVVEAGAVKAVMARRADRPLVILDLAVPHDIPREVAELASIHLIGMDELEALASENRLSRHAESAKARLLIAAAVERFFIWWNSRQITPTISEMLAHANKIRNDETNRALARLGELDEKQQEIVRSLGMRIISQLFHMPLKVLKSHPEGANLGWAIQQLFGLSEVEPVPGFVTAHHHHSKAPAHPEIEESRSTVVAGERSST